MSYRRLTLVGKGAPERVTVDFDLQFTAVDGTGAQTPPRVLIVEVKSPQGRGRADGYLRATGARPVQCSKYCVGLNLLRPGLPYNRFKPVLVNHFDWQPRR